MILFVRVMKRDVSSKTLLLFKSYKNIINFGDLTSDLIGGE